MNHAKLKGFFMGVATTVIIGSSLSLASGHNLKNISVIMDGVKIFVDGNIQIPTDVKGNRVEPLIYDGTTYLPVRALTGMLTDKEVGWDGKTQSVYIGKQPTVGSTPIDEVKPYTGHGFATGERAQFRLLDKTISPFNSSSWGYDSSVYITDSKYSSINGKFVIPYTSLGSTSTGYLEIISVDRYGKETLIERFEAKAGDNPIDINVDIRSVNILKIKSTESKSFYNVTLSGI